MTGRLTNAREFTRFLRFAVVGVIGAVVDFGIENLLHRWLGVDYVISGGVSFVSAILSNFFWNRYWTYPDSRSKPIGKQLGEFALVSAAGLAIRLPMLHFLEPVITRWTEALPPGLWIMPPDLLGENITLAIAVIVVMFWNFFVNRYWTYNDVK
jgi:putative flippase GtrA